MRASRKSENVTSAKSAANTGLAERSTKDTRQPRVAGPSSSTKQVRYCVVGTAGTANKCFVFIFLEDASTVTPQPRTGFLTNRLRHVVVH